MKKFLTTSIILSMLALTLTGCTSKNNNSSNASGNSSITGEPNGTGTSEGNSAASENTATGETNNNETSSNETSNAPSGTGEASDNLPDANGRAARMGEAAMNAVEWPAMMDVEDAETVEMFFGIDLKMCEDYFFSSQLISAQLNEIVIAKPAEGSEDALKEAFDAHFEYIRNEAAFYPAQEASAAGAVSGTTEDGYYYIIVHENGADAASALLAAE